MIQKLESNSNFANYPKLYYSKLAIISLNANPSSPNKNFIGFREKHENWNIFEIKSKIMYSNLEFRMEANMMYKNHTYASNLMSNFTYK